MSVRDMVQRFEGDNIKSQYSGSGKEFYSIAGFAYGKEKSYSNVLVKGGKTRDVDGMVAAKISENFVKMENASKVQAATRGVSAGR